MEIDFSEWRPIKGFDNRYEVSSDGRVASKNYMKSGRRVELKQFKSDNGYMRVGLSNGGKLQTVSVHRLVASAFIPNPDNLPQVNHKNENKSDNRVENLEWCNQNYNNEYGSRPKRVMEHNQNNPKQNCRVVFQYTLDGDFVRVWPSLSEIQRELGFAYTNIQSCCIGKRKTAYGFVWKYAD